MGGGPLVQKTIPSLAVDSQWFCVDSSFFGVWFISGGSWRYLLWLCYCLHSCFCGGCVLLFCFILRVKLLDGLADDLRWSVACGD